MTKLGHSHSESLVSGWFPTKHTVSTHRFIIVGLHFSDEFTFKKLQLFHTFCRRIDHFPHKRRLSIFANSRAKVGNIASSCRAKMGALSAFHSL